MSNDNRARQPSGQPTGGQYAEANRGSSGIALSKPSGEAPEGISPGDLMDAIRRDGQDWDVETVAIRDRWSPRDWEDWEDAREEADLEDAHSAPIEHGGIRAQLYTSEIDGATVVQVDTDELPDGGRVRVVLNDGSPVYDGDPESDMTHEQRLEHEARLAGGADYSDQLNDVMSQYRQLETEMERLSAGVVAQAVRKTHPGAQSILLEPSDQGPYWQGVEVLGDDRESIADFEDLAYGEHEEDLVALSNLYAGEPLPFIHHSADGRTAYFDLDAAEAHARGE